MRAVVMHETGGPEVLRLEEVPDPEPGPGETLVRVEAAGVNHYDVNQRARDASRFPAILGRDAAGTRADTGGRVLVTGARGCYAELVAVPEERAWAIPDSLSAATAAAIGVPYRTAWWAIVELAGLAEGARLLVQAASSVTGQASVDIGRALGATVFATASAGKLDRVAALGAEAFAYDDPRVGGLEADVVFDPVGAETFATSVAAPAKGGRLVTPGAVGDPTVSFDVWNLVDKQARIIGIGSAPAARATLERLIALASDRRLRPVIDRELPLGQAAEAHRLIETREVFGKVILRP